MSDNISTWVDSGTLDQCTSTHPLVVLMHGYGSHERDLPGIMSWMGIDTPWVSLRAPVPLNQGGFAWFPITTPLNPSAADVENPTNAVWSWIDGAVAPDVPIIAMGFSQGGLMASQLLRTRPGRVVSTVILSGFVAGIPQVGDEILAETKPPVLWARGTADQVVSTEAVAMAHEFLANHATVDEKIYPGLGHSIDERVLQDVKSFLSAH